MSDLDVLRDDVRTSWQRFLDVFEPMRPELYRYCRYLTRSPWEAEDLVQDALARAFATLGTRFHDIRNPRAWLFRVASNLWRDGMRRREREAALMKDSSPLHVTDNARNVREAAGTLLVQLAPQERAAVVLKDVFEFPLEDIALALETTVGAVKAALHRGRGKLVEPEADTCSVPVPEVLDELCIAFNARDLGRLTSLLLDTAVTEIVGVVNEYGAEEPADPRFGSLFHSLMALAATETGGIASAYLADYAGGPPHAERVSYRDAPVVLLWFDHATEQAVRGVWTVGTQGDRIAHIRNYFFAPDVLTEVCGELRVPFRSNGYRYW